MAKLQRFDGRRWVLYCFDPKRDYEAWLCTDAWAAIREAALDRADRQCDECGSSRQLQVHHKHYRTLGAEQPEDLKVLCNECHLAEHNEDF